MFAIFRAEPIRNCDAVAHGISERCLKELRQQIGPSAAVMGAAELQGYLRAKAYPILQARIAAISASDHRSTADAQQLTAKVLERIVHLALKDFETPPVVLVAAPHVRLRQVA
jgi:hypothetical protein